jgi:SHS family lactate transporter-like MFS transporter
MVLQIFRNLVPPRQVLEGERTPLLKALFSLSWIQVAQLFSGWLAQTCDSIDIFNVATNAERFNKQFHQDKAIVMMIVVSLNSLFRIFGGILFGILSDRFGRKWPLVAILLSSSLLQLGTGFTQTIEEFLVLRCLSGLAMGGVWGISVSNALENLPVETRGLASGILGQGYALGCLISTVMNTYLVTDNPHTWRILFWIGSGMIALAAIVRAAIPESRAFLRANARKEAQMRTGQGSKSIIREAGLVLKTNWKSCLICVAVVANVNAVVHGAQDLYPTYLLDTKGFTVLQATITAMVGSCGAIVGAVIAGTLSQVAGRRLTIVLFLLFGTSFIPLWMLPSTFAKLCAGVFWVQFGMQGAIGVIPIWLVELSPPGFCALFPGVIAQMGNLLGSGSGKMESILAGAKRLEKMIIVNGKSTEVPGYETAMCIILAIVIFASIKFLHFAAENHGSHFEARNATFEEGGHTPHHLSDSLEEEKEPHMTVKHLNLELSRKLVWSELP